MERRYAGAVRAISCAGLLVLLAVSGYMGAASAQKSTAASVPIVRTQLNDQTPGTQGYEETAETLRAQREAELALLDSVLENPQTDAETARSALAQKTQIAARMETEALASACLRNMGIEPCTALCGAQMLTVFVPAHCAADEAEAAKVIGAVSGAVDFEPEAVKIILLKK